MKKVFSLIIIFIAVFSLNSFAFQNEPEGFRGIKWGTNIKTLKNMDILYEKGGFSIYTRNTDKRQIGDVKLLRIKYFFWNNKFIKVQMLTSGYDELQNIWDILIEKFGKHSNSGHNAYEWGKPFIGKAYIFLSYEVGPRHLVFLSISGVDVSKEKRQFDEQQSIKSKENELKKRKAKAQKGLNDF